MNANDFLHMELWLMVMLSVLSLTSLCVPIYDSQSSPVFTTTVHANYGILYNIKQFISLLNLYRYIDIKTMHMQ